MPTTQTRIVIETLARLGHATNLDLHGELEGSLPELSLPSLHRITARLVDRGEIGTVASDSRHIVLDIRPDVHHHFVCTACGGIVDIDLPSGTLEAIQEQLGTHLAGDGLIVRGTCAICRTSVGDGPADTDPD